MPPLKTVRLHHLLILLTALGLLPIALIGAWGISVAVDQQRRELERSMLDISRALASAVDAELEASISALRTLSYSPALARGDLAAFFEMANDAVKARPDWTGIALNDGTGHLVFETGFFSGAAANNPIDRTSLAEAIANRLPVIGNIATGKSAPAAVPVRVPVLANGDVSYVLSAAIRPDRVLEIVQRQKVPDSWVISVHDASSLRVARSRDHEQTIATGISPSLAKLMQDKRSEGAGVSHTLEGTEALTAYTRLPRYGWTVVIGAPTTHLRQTLIQSYALYSAVIAASLAICIALAIAISRTIVTAIGGLQEQAARLGHGEPVRIAGSPIHEVNQMGLALQAASMERMAVERERENLMNSLNTALVSLREALASAEEANRAKDNFLAVLGHELRNPLAPMVTGLDLMDAKGDTNNLRERQIMRRQVDHMKRMVDDLLDVSRITQGKLEIRKVPVSLQSVIEQALEAVQPAIARHGCDITVSMSDDAWVIGDETRLVQVVTNLLGNALRYGGEGEIAVRLSCDGQQARVVVCDHGTGMLPETAEQVFKPFYQAPQSLARSSGGLGLGLAIVRSIVELHGGTVSARSEGMNRGSEFEVLLPAVDAPGEQCTAGAPFEQAHRHARILVVDDNVDAAQTIAEILKITGHDVQVAHDAAGALALLPEFEPDLAILDIGLPDMDGFELARTIRARLPGWSGRLIALTGYGQDGDKSRSAEAGFDLHLTKPVKTRDLLSAVGRLNSTEVH